MALSAFRNLVHFEQANWCVTYTQMIGTTDFVSGLDNQGTVNIKIFWTLEKLL